MVLSFRLELRNGLLLRPAGPERSGQLPMSVNSMKTANAGRNDGPAQRGAAKSPESPGWRRELRCAARWLLVAVGLLGGEVGAGPTNLAQLRGALMDSIASLKAPGAAWGVQVVKLSDGAPVVSINADRQFVPASCTKLFTTALALERLGAGFRIVTPLRADGEVDANGTLHGNLVWEGHGAPDLGERRSGSVAAALAPYADAVVRAGIRRVDGAVLVDESGFHTTPFGSGWNWDDLAEAYGAAVSSLSFNDNVAQVSVRPGAVGQPAVIQVTPMPELYNLHNQTRTGPPNGAKQLTFERLPGSRDLWVSGSLPSGHAGHEEHLSVPEPAAAAGRLLREALTQRGIAISQTVQVLGWRDRPGVGGRGRWIGAVTSAPLAELVRECLKPSQNLHAQLLLLQVGADVEAHPRGGEAAGTTTDESALRGLDLFLQSLGIARDEYSFEEGSGLSRKNLVTPAVTVRLLRYMARQAKAPARAAWWEALPVGGVDGTLKGRFTTAPARGNVRAKTGTLRHIHSLAGYVTTAGGDALAFTVYLNGLVTTDSRTSGRGEVDRLIEILAAYPGRL